MIKATLRGLAIILVTLAVALPASAALLGVSAPETQTTDRLAAPKAERVVLVQSGYGQQLIPPTVALKRAVQYAGGGNVLQVRLRRGARPVYVVKVKKKGQIRRVRVDARSGRVLR